jgi:hypothetical protein
VDTYHSRYLFFYWRPTLSLIKRLNKQLDEYRRGVHAVEIYDSEDENTTQKNSKRMAISSNGKNIKTEPRESYDRFKNIYSENSN